jgi:hypothetical protein
VYCLHSRQRTGTTSRVDTSGREGPISGGISDPAISADGRHIASNLVPDDTNDSWDVFVRTRTG